MSSLAKVTKWTAVQIPTLARILRPKLQTAWRYARVEMKPPAPRDWPEIQRGFQNLAAAAKARRWRGLTVREAWLNTLVGVEIACWFFVGEMIGRGNLFGYHVKA